MGRFSSKFNPKVMAQTAKQLVFGKNSEDDLMSDEMEIDRETFNIVESSERVNDKGKKKRMRVDEDIEMKEVAVREKIDSKEGEGIRLFGKTIKVDQGESSKGRSKVERVYTLGELVKQDRAQTAKERSLAVRKKVEQDKLYTPVSRDSLSPGVGLLEGRGDNFAGVHISPSSTISYLFNQVIGCFSPARVPTVERVESSVGQPFAITGNGSFSGEFSFVTPMEGLLQPYDPVEEWWPRRASPSLQYSVTSIDPFLERHPVWLQRYQQTLQSTQEARNEGMSAGGGSGETVTFPKYV